MSDTGTSQPAHDPRQEELVARMIAAVRVGYVESDFVDGDVVIDQVNAFFVSAFGDLTRKERGERLEAALDTAKGSIDDKQHYVLGFYCRAGLRNHI